MGSARDRLAALGRANVRAEQRAEWLRHVRELSEAAMAEALAIADPAVRESELFSTYALIADSGPSTRRPILAPSEIPQRVLQAQAEAYMRRLEEEIAR